MKSALESPKNKEADQTPVEERPGERLSVLRELDSILSSRHFKSADRCKQFLRYVVLNKLDGHTDRLKERAIGTEVFNRLPGYATGEDPVVRVQAGEVRRRLEQYYRETPLSSQLRIELPVGSYAPVFHPGSTSGTRKAPTLAGPPTASVRRSKPHLWVVVLLAATILAAFAGRTLFRSLHRGADPKTTLEQFWGPAIASHQPILICLANASNRPSDNITQPSSQSQSGISQTKGNTPPSSNVNEQFSPIDRPVSPEIVPAADASVAVTLSGLFGKLDRPIQLRIGAASTYEDLRNSPAAIIGGFNNKWTMQLVSNLHFAFLWDRGQYMIREQLPNGRLWTTRFGPRGETVEDFAIVGRLIDSKTGQFTVTVAGIGPRGTQAAGEFVSSSHYLEEGLVQAPLDWQNRNLEVLLQTTVTDSVAGPPHVIATYVW